MTTAPDIGPQLAAAVPAARLAVVPPPAPLHLDLDLDDVLRRATPRLQRYAVRRLYDSHEAEEVVQEALLRAYQHRESFATEDDLMAWVTVVTSRLVIDRVRVRGRSVPVAEVPTASRVARDTADVVVARDEARAALDALEAMPARQAAVLWAREVEGLSYDEIARRHALSEPTVRSLLHRARKTLRREYAARGGTLPAGGLVVLAPWMTGLRLAGRARALARRTAGVTGATAAGLAVVGAVSIGTSPVAPAPRIAAPPAASVATVASTPTRSLPAATAGEPVRRATTTPADVEPAQPERTSRTISALPQACSVGVNCSTHREPTLYLGPALPTNPTGYRRIGISDNHVDCGLVPTTVVTSCVAPAQSSTPATPGATK